MVTGVDTQEPESVEKSKEEERYLRRHNDKIVDKSAADQTDEDMLNHGNAQAAADEMKTIIATTSKGETVLDSPYIDEVQKKNIETSLSTQTDETFLHEVKVPEIQNTNSFAATSTYNVPYLHMEEHTPSNVNKETKEEEQNIHISRDEKVELNEPCHASATDMLSGRETRTEERKLKEPAEPTPDNTEPSTDIKSTNPIEDEMQATKLETDLTAAPEQVKLQLEDEEKITKEQNENDITKDVILSKDVPEPLDDAGERLNFGAKGEVPDAGMEDKKAVTISENFSQEQHATPKEQLDEIIDEKTYIDFAATSTASPPDNLGNTFESMIETENKRYPETNEVPIQEKENCIQDNKCEKKTKEESESQQGTKETIDKEQHSKATTDLVILSREAREENEEMTSKELESVSTELNESTNKKTETCSTAAAPAASDEMVNIVSKSLQKAETEYKRTPDSIENPVEEKDNCITDIDVKETKEVKSPLEVEEKLNKEGTGNDIIVAAILSEEKSKGEERYLRRHDDKIVDKGASDQRDRDILSQGNSQAAVDEMKTIIDATSKDETILNSPYPDDVQNKIVDKGVSDQRDEDILNQGNTQAAADGIKTIINVTPKGETILKSPYPAEVQNKSIETFLSTQTDETCLQEEKLPEIQNENCFGATSTDKIPCLDVGEYTILNVNKETKEEEETIHISGDEKVELNEPCRASATDMLSASATDMLSGPETRIEEGEKLKELSEPTPDNTESSTDTKSTRPIEDEMQTHNLKTDLTAEAEQVKLQLEVEEKPTKEQTENGSIKDVILSRDVPEPLDDAGEKFHCGAKDEVPDVGVKDKKEVTISENFSEEQHLMPSKEQLGDRIDEKTYTDFAATSTASPPDEKLGNAFESMIETENRRHPETNEVPIQEKQNCIQVNKCEEMIKDETESQQDTKETIGKEQHNKATTDSFSKEARDENEEVASKELESVSAEINESTNRKTETYSSATATAASDEMLNIAPKSMTAECKRTQELIENPMEEKDTCITDIEVIKDSKEVKSPLEVEDKLNKEQTENDIILTEEEFEGSENAGKKLNYEAKDEVPVQGTEDQKEVTAIEINAKQLALLSTVSDESTNEKTKMHLVSAATSGPNIMLDNTNESIAETETEVHPESTAEPLEEKIRCIQDKESEKDTKEETRLHQEGEDSIYKEQNENNIIKAPTFLEDVREEVDNTKELGNGSDEVIFEAKDEIPLEGAKHQREVSIIGNAVKEQELLSVGTDENVRVGNKIDTCVTSAITVGLEEKLNIATESVPETEIRTITHAQSKDEAVEKNKNHTENKEHEKETKEELISELETEEKIKKEQNEIDNVKAVIFSAEVKEDETFEILPDEKEKVTCEAMDEGLKDKKEVTGKDSIIEQHAASLKEQGPRSIELDEKIDARFTLAATAGSDEKLENVMESTAEPENKIHPKFDKTSMEEKTNCIKDKEGQKEAKEEMEPHLESEENINKKQDAKEIIQAVLLPEVHEQMNKADTLDTKEKVNCEAKDEGTENENKMTTTENPSKEQDLLSAEFSENTEPHLTSAATAGPDERLNLSFESVTETEDGTHLEAIEKPIEESQHCIQEKECETETIKGRELQLEAGEKIKRDQNDTDNIKEVLLSAEVHEGIDEAEALQNAAEKVTSKAKDQPFNEVTEDKKEVTSSNNLDRELYDIPSKEQESNENDTMMGVISSKEAHKEVVKSENSDVVGEQVNHEAKDEIPEDLQSFESDERHEDITGAPFMVAATAGPDAMLKDVSESEAETENKTIHVESIETSMEMKINAIQDKGDEEETQEEVEPHLEVKEKINKEQTENYSSKASFRNESQDEACDESFERPAISLTSPINQSEGQTKEVQESYNAMVTLEVAETIAKETQLDVQLTKESKISPDETAFGGTNTETSLQVKQESTELEESAYNFVHQLPNHHEKEMAAIVIRSEYEADKTETTFDMNSASKNQDLEETDGITNHLVGQLNQFTPPHLEHAKEVTTSVGNVDGDEYGNSELVTEEVKECKDQKTRENYESGESQTMEKLDTVESIIVDKISCDLPASESKSGEQIQNPSSKLVNEEMEQRNTTIFVTSKEEETQEAEETSLKKNPLTDLETSAEEKCIVDQALPLEGLHKDKAEDINLLQEQTAEHGAPNGVTLVSQTLLDETRNEQNLQPETLKEAKNIQEEKTREAEIGKVEKQEVPDSLTTAKESCLQEEEPKNLELPNKEEDTTNQITVAERSLEQLQIPSSVIPYEDQDPRSASVALKQVKAEEEAYMPGNGVEEDVFMKQTTENIFLEKEDLQPEAVKENKSTAAEMVKEEASGTQTQTPPNTLHKEEPTNIAKVETIVQENQKAERPTDESQIVPLAAKPTDESCLQSGEHVDLEASTENATTVDQTLLQENQDEINQTQKTTIPVTSDKHISQEAGDIEIMKTITSSKNMVNPSNQQEIVVESIMKANNDDLEDGNVKVVQAELTKPEHSGEKPMEATGEPTNKEPALVEMKLADISLSALLKKSEKDEVVNDKQATEEKDKEEEFEELKDTKTDSESTMVVEAKDAENKTVHKKPQGILSGVGSKVKHSIIKVKKAIIGKSSHPKT